jgi:DNA invertase Pin-like site-specific DNA recombinase
MTNRGKDDRGVSEYGVSGYLYGAPVRQAMGGAGGHEPGRLHDLSRQISYTRYTIAGRAGSQVDGTTVAGDRAGLLVRVSSGGQDEANQVPDVERHAAAKGYREIKRYVLHDASASKGEQQATLDQILADARAGIIKVLVVWKPSRIERRGTEYLCRFVRLVREAGGRVERADTGAALHENDIHTILDGYMDHEYSNTISANVRQSHRSIQANGAFRGKIPFGYKTEGPKLDKHLVPIEVLRPVIKEIFQRVLDGESLADICYWLDSLKIKRASTDGKKSRYKAGDLTPWWPAMLMKLIRHPAYSGRYYVRQKDEHGQITTYTHKCEAIVSARTQRQVIEALANREKRGPRGNPDTRAMLKGDIYCPSCDNSPMYRMTGRLAGGRQEYYRCYGRGPQRQGCGNMVKMSLVDDAVDTIIAEAFAFPMTQFVRIKGEDHEGEIEAVKDQIRELGGLDLPDDEYDRRLAELRAERDRLRALPAEPDEIREVELDELWSDAWAAVERHDRGAWLIKHGFRVYASKEQVRVVLHEGEITEVWSTFDLAPSCGIDVVSGLAGQSARKVQPYSRHGASRSSVRPRPKV